jgi:hypothetical protein
LGRGFALLHKEALMPTKLADRAFLACAAMVLAAALGLVLAAVLNVQGADALPIYARQTGLPCAKCHVNPQGGGPRTAFGRAFARNGHHLPGGKSGGSSSASRSRSHRRSYGHHDGYGYHGYGMGPGMMGGYGGMGPGMMGGYGR